MFCLFLSVSPVNSAWHLKVKLCCTLVVTKSRNSKNIVFLVREKLSCSWRERLIWLSIRLLSNGWWTFFAIGTPWGKMWWLLQIAEYEVAGTLVWSRWYVTLNWNLCCPSKNVLIWLTLVTNTSTSFGATKPRWRAMHSQCTELVFAFHSLLRRLKRSWLVTYCFRGCFFPRFVQKCCDAVSAIPMDSYRDKSLDGSAVCSENLSS